MDKRTLEIVVISDVHLGAYECHAVELLKYLKSIEPKVLILNGDFLDAMQFKKRSLSKEHALVVKEILDKALQQTKVYYVTGNRDKVLKRFSEFSSSGVNIRYTLELQLENAKYWIFHGDTFSPYLKKYPLFMKLGSKIYGFLLRSDRVINKWRLRFGKARMSYAGRIKSRVKRSLEAIKIFEETALELAREEGYDYIICGHIHKPIIKSVEVDGHPVTYMNSGDWVEHLTALEYNFGKWNLYEYDELDFGIVNPKLQVRSKKTKTSNKKVSTKERFGSIIGTDNQLRTS